MLHMLYNIHRCASSYGIQICHIGISIGFRRNIYFNSRFHAVYFYTEECADHHAILGLVCKHFLSCVVLVSEVVPL